MQDFSQWRTIHWVLASIILLTLPCYCIGITMLAIAPEHSTPTPTSTTTPMPSPTPILTATPTQTLPPTPTQWLPPTHTATPEATPTGTPPPTDTPTPTPTPTVMPEIDVSKSADPTSVVETGGDVRFAVVVTNDGSKDATITEFADSDFDLGVRCPGTVGKTLVPGASYTCTFTEFVAGDAGGANHENTVSVTVTDSEGHSDTAQDSASVTFTDSKTTDVSVSKTANPATVPETGGDVQFTIVVTNEGPEAVTITGLTDSDFDLGAHCPAAIGKSLASGGSHTCNFTEFIAGDFGGLDHENIVSATAADDEGNSDTSQATATVTFTDNKTTDVSVSKTANPTAVPEAGGDVQFTIVVTNKGPEAVTITGLTDSDFDLGVRCPAAVGKSLAPDGSHTCNFTEFISGTVSGPAHENTVTVTAADDEGNSDTAQATATVTFIGGTPDTGSLQMPILAMSGSPLASRSILWKSSLY